MCLTGELFHLFIPVAVTDSAVMSMYTGAKTVVRTVYGNSNGLK